jgi:hypothetical protein
VSGHDNYVEYVPVKKEQNPELRTRESINKRSSILLSGRLAACASHRTSLGFDVYLWMPLISHLPVPERATRRNRRNNTLPAFSPVRVVEHTTSKMTAGLPFPQEATPYAWDDTRPTPPETLRLWTEVGNGIDKSQTGTLVGGTFR